MPHRFGLQIRDPLTTPRNLATQRLSLPPHCGNLRLARRNRAAQLVERTRVLRLEPGRNLPLARSELREHRRREGGCDGVELGGDAIQRPAGGLVVGVALERAQRVVGGLDPVGDVRTCGQLVP
ncbi:MAG: hypothetical protein ABWZ74_03845 [Hyphomicrobiaceae bacterium]